jgi:hypothetical protein
MKGGFSMTKRLVTCILVLLVGVAFLSCAHLPKGVKGQSRKDVVQPETWNKFDKSGQVRFLQVQTTAPGSEAGKGSSLDGSLGERLIEIKVDPDIQDSVVEWSLTNEGKSTVWVVAASKPDTALPLSIEGKGSAILRTSLDKDRYTYIVVDNEAGGKASLDIKAKCGGKDAKTASGKSMSVVWF